MVQEFRSDNRIRICYRRFGAAVIFQIDSDVVLSIGEKGEPFEGLGKC